MDPIYKILEGFRPLAENTDPCIEELKAMMRAHSPEDANELWATTTEIADEFKGTPTGEELAAILRGHSVDDPYELWDTLTRLVNGEWEY
jgi:hypothetical protein